MMNLNYYRKSRKKTQIKRVSKIVEIPISMYTTTMPISNPIITATQSLKMMRNGGMVA